MTEKQANEKKKQKAFRAGLRLKITTPFVILIILAVGIVTIASYNFRVQALIDQRSQHAELQMANVDKAFEIYLENMENTLVHLAGNKVVTDYTEDDFQELLNQLQWSTVNENILAAYVGYDATEEFIIYPYDSSVQKVNPKEREWYRQAIEAEGETVWTNPYIDVISGDYVISSAKAFYEGDRLIGVVGVDFHSNVLLSFLDETFIQENGSVFAIDENGVIVLHPDLSRIDENVSETNYFREMQTKGDQGVINARLGGEEVVVVYVKNPITNWYLTTIVEKSHFTKSANGIVLPVAITLIIVISITVIVAYYISRRIIRPIEQLEGSMKQVETGDLTTTIAFESDDEIGSLSHSYNHMVNEMRRVIDRIARSGQQILDASQNLVANAEENTASANEVAKAMEEIAAGASNQADLTEQSTRAFRSLTEMLEDIKQKNKEMYEKAKDMGRLSKTGVETIQFLAVRSADTKDMAASVMREIEQLNEQSANITTIVDKIANIARQTNLLALNASIEAARAGEHGHGFAVVASEVGKLAEQTTDALKEVGDIITAMQEDMNHSVDLVQETMELFEQQNESVAETGQAFLAISGSVNDNHKLTEQIMQLTNEMAELENQVMESTMNFAKISEDTAAGTEEISASIEEQTAAMEQLTHLASELETIAISMQEEVGKFKVN